ncbi:hypothetical protein SUGI_0199030 [Cryptomeria japonica]|nr:hypothetical protein SUGI_0199030 [Cryptomeria japonica]
MGLGIWAVFLLLPSIICCSACLQEERNSLLDFKQGINFTYTRDQFQVKPLESWKGLNCCNWEGVGCHPPTAHVITLDLSYHLGYVIQWSEVRGVLFQLLHLEHLDLTNNYFGTLSIPPQVGKMRRLKYLRLYGCEFAGQIPKELGKLQQLEHLDLYYNHLHGVIPREMGNMSTLKFLDLSDNDGLQSNKLGEWIPNLRGLEYLGLSTVNLSMAQGTWLGGCLLSLTNLTALYMNGCGLSGEIPPSFANLSRLQYLELRRNSFRGKIPIFLGALLLSEIDLSDNNLEGFIPSSLGGLSNLQDLHLSSNKLNGSIPSTLGNLSKLYRLDLSSNKLNGSIPSTLGNLSKLDMLALQDNSLGGPVPTSFAKLSKLQGLFLANNRLNGTFSFFILNNYPKLSYLDLSNNMMTLEISASLIPKFQLEYLDLHEWMIPQGGQMMTFDSKYFFNNLGLCGLQIYVSCSSSPPNSPKAHEEDNEDSEDDIWWDMGMAISFVVGFSIVMGMLWLNKTWISHVSNSWMALLSLY